MFKNDTLCLQMFPYGLESVCWPRTSIQHIQKNILRKKNILKTNLRRIAVPEARQNTLRKHLEKQRCVPKIASPDARATFSKKTL